MDMAEGKGTPYLAIPHWIIWEERSCSVTNSTPDARWRRQIIVVLAIMLATASSIVLCPAPDVSAGTYNPLKAVQYANQWWNKRNPKFQSYGFNDCANYVSQCLIAGGLSLRASPSADKSGSLAQCTSLDAYLTNTLKATVWKTSSSARPPTALQPGDVAIFGNWLGLRHAVFVSAKQTNGQPLFNAHTYDRLRTTIDWLFSAWTYVKYYHIVKSPITVAVAAKPATPAKTAVVAQPAVTTRSSIPLNPSRTGRVRGARQDTPPHRSHRPLRCCMASSGPMDNHSLVLRVWCLREVRRGHGQAGTPPRQHDL